MHCHARAEVNPHLHHVQPCLYLTLLVVLVFAGIKAYYDKIRQRSAKLAVVVLGAGPVGMTTALIAIRSGRASSLTIYESDDKFETFKRNYQIAVDRKSVSFLRKQGIDFENIEGCWDGRCFYTQIGVYLEYILNAIKSSSTTTDIKFHTKVSSAMPCQSEDMEEWAASYQVQQTILLTVMFLAFFTGWRSLYEKIRRSYNHLNLVVVGAGPIGLSSAFLALQTGRVSKLVIYEEKKKKALINMSYQISFDENSVKFLKSMNIDFDNMEGCWENGTFSTKVGVYLEYILERLQTVCNTATVLYSTKFDRERCKDLDNLPGRLLVIACDGRNGQASRVLGLSDFCQQHSCGAYGAIAAVDRTEQRDVPTPEKRVHNLTFDLSAYGSYSTDTDGSPGFSLKIFGNSKHRFISLAIQRCDSPVVKTLRTILDRSMMRNIFLKCFNQYKVDSEPSISDSYALNHMKFSPRLFEIKLSQRCETVAYFADCDMFVLAEGEAAMSFNFHTGLDINPAIRGLASLNNFIEMISIAETEHSISEALLYKIKHTECVCKELVKSGLREYMLS